MSLDARAYHHCLSCLHCPVVSSISVHLPLLYCMQVAAAAARHEAQEAARKQLQQQAQAAAQSYMAAWRIARAWRVYRHSPAHGEKHAAAVTLQAAIRGANARQALKQLQVRHRLLLALDAAERSAQQAALELAASAAAEAGEGDVVGVSLHVPHANR